MILVQLNNDQLIALKQDANFAQLVDMLLSIQALRTARDPYFRPRPDGWIEVNDKYLSFQTILALNSAHGVAFKNIRVYVEVDDADKTLNVPSYLPDATRTELDSSGNPIQVPNTWADLISRTSLDGNFHICSLSDVVDLSQLSQLLQEPKITVMNHPDTLARIQAAYNNPNTPI